MRKIKAALGTGILLTSLLSGQALAATKPTQLVPLRAVAESIGAQVRWEAATSTVTVTKGGSTLVVKLGTTEVTLNGQPVPLAQPIQLVADRTLVPASLLESFGATNPLSVQVRYEGALETALFQPTWAADFETYAQTLFPFATTCPGMAYGIAQDGQEVLLRSFGARDCEQSLPMTTDTVMGIGSSTKAFTAVAIMQLVDAGKLSVDDLVTKYIPEYRTTNPADADRTTIHHLMTHSAGLPPLPILFSAMAESLDADPSVPPPLKGMKPLKSVTEMIDAIVAAPIGQVDEPGKLFSYSNESYTLLGEIVHQVSGLPYEEYVTERILKPAGMIHTVWTDADLPEVATLYTMVPQPESPLGVGALATPVWWDLGVMNPAGGLRSTVQDMLRFTEIFRTGGLVGETRLLSAASVKQMITPYIEAETGVSYGYGVMIKQMGDLTVVEHGGANKGVAAIFSIIPEKGLTGVGLTNAAGIPSEMILHGGLNLAAGQPLMTGTAPRPTIQVDEATLAKYAGTYAGGEAAPATFTVENGTLVFDQAGMKLPTRPVGKDEFALPLGAVEANVRFIADEKGDYYAISIGFRIWRKL